MQFHVQDMTCGSCVRHINEAIGKVDPAKGSVAKIGGSQR